MARMFHVEHLGDLSPLVGCFTWNIESPLDGGTGRGDDGAVINASGNAL